MLPGNSGSCHGGTGGENETILDVAIFLGLSVLRIDFGFDKRCKETHETQMS